ncbi:SDR family oxidoreductase [Aureimonas leprariae]|uniref:SDR family NAD(P)-dependent oxidoreductase n=1 Tax=Plantimonas leprariae TaxID=2615207 RepID=A0A7V7TVU1_9HYPH|nr:SDR family oxidoreductase [Aureimonas leprariae]KAB0679086.1 SDR family NAD(P)-dependent oxidoreductase [Aureimonas leprariae]
MKTVVVTGASAGIGLAIAERFASAGWQVAVLARDEARLTQATAMLERHGGRVLGLPVDVADASAVNAAADRVATELGGIDAWVNNAMSTVVARAHEITPDEYARVTATTYLSQVHGTLAALRYMRERNRGAIVQVSSGLAIRAAPLQAAYCGAKAAVGGFTDSLRAELIADRSAVTLTVVYLPAVDTPQPGWARNRTGREQVLPDPLFDPRLCAEAVFSAVEDPQREIWVGRSTVMMAIAQVAVPAYADRKAAEMIDSMQGAPMPARDGNLDATVRGPARIDGEGGSRTIRSRHEFLTSRQLDLIKAGAVGGLLVAGAAARSVLRRALPDLRR